MSTNVDIEEYSGGALQLSEHAATALADRRIHRVLTNPRRVVPAPLTLRSLRLLHCHVYAAGAVARPLRESNRRDDKQIAKLPRITLQQCVQCVGCCDLDMGLESGANELAIPS